MSEAAPPNDSELRPSIEQFTADEDNLDRIHPFALSDTRFEKLSALYDRSSEELRAVEFEDLSRKGQVDCILFGNYLSREKHRLAASKAENGRFAPLVPFAQAILGFEESRRRLISVDPQRCAHDLDALTHGIEALQKPTGSRFETNQAVEAIKKLKEILKGWFECYSGYDPLFTWWLSEPYRRADKAMQEYIGRLREQLLGIKADEEHAIVGRPIGREAVLTELEDAVIPYSPEALIRIGEQQYAWCLDEMRKASKELGHGSDWMAALEHVKELHVEPGRQPDLIRELAQEAIAFIEERDLVTVPELAKETWTFAMMSPERQLESPFFLGGRDIIISYPTDTMPHAQKRMSMRGNNRFFSRATVQHELIPGHHLQWFMNQRYNRYRRLFNTPFWVEGWALNWEMLLWDEGFPRTAEERIGMLFWRMHRCVRIVFSLKFHLGEMTPEECIEMLVDRVGHERANAEGEVRRSFKGDYEPLYQLAYMIGGLQVEALRKELVASGKMTVRQFHDRMLKENMMPIEVLRALLTEQKLTKEFRSSWRFAGAV